MQDGVWYDNDKQMILQVGDEVMSLTCWAKRTGIPKHTIYMRVKAGWRPELAVSIAPRKVRLNSEYTEQCVMLTAQHHINDVAADVVQKDELYEIPSSIYTEISQMAANNGTSVQHFVDEILITAVAIMEFKNKYKKEEHVDTQPVVLSQPVQKLPEPTDDGEAVCYLDKIDLESMPDDIPLDVLMSMIH